MKKELKILGLLAVILMVIPFAVKAENDDSVTLICDNETEAFKVGTSRTCHATVQMQGTDRLLEVTLGEDLTEKVVLNNDNYAIQADGKGRYLIIKKNPTTAPFNLDVILNLTSDSVALKTGVELRLYSQYTAILVGNLNEDTLVSQADIDMLEQYLNQEITLTDYSKKAADINEDGKINEEDLQLLKKMVAEGAEKVFRYEKVDTDLGESSGTILFDVDCTPVTPGPSNPDETVDVPDTASNISIWLYVGGAICIAFGTFLIIESRRDKKK